MSSGLVHNGNTRSPSQMTPGLNPRAIMDMFHWWALIKAKLESGTFWVQGWQEGLWLIRRKCNPKGSQTERKYHECHTLLTSNCEIFTCSDYHCELDSFVRYDYAIAWLPDIISHNNRFVKLFFFGQKASLISRLTPVLWIRTIDCLLDADKISFVLQLTFICQVGKHLDNWIPI